MTNEERRNIGLKGKKYFDENFKREMLLDKLEMYLMNISKELNKVKGSTGDEQYV